MVWRSDEESQGILEVDLKAFKSMKSAGVVVAPTIRSEECPSLHKPEVVQACRTQLGPTPSDIDSHRDSLVDSIRGGENLMLCGKLFKHTGEKEAEERESGLRRLSLEPMFKVKCLWL